MLRTITRRLGRQADVSDSAVAAQETGFRARTVPMRSVLPALRCRIYVVVHALPLVDARGVGGPSCRSIQNGWIDTRYTNAKRGIRRCGNADF